MIVHFLLFDVNICDWISSALVTVKLLKTQALCFVERKLISDGCSDSLWIAPCYRSRNGTERWQRLINTYSVNDINFRI
jgi:hypothetical protein